ncbi:MAG: NGG1p interacting factor NIF3 [Porticoccaceae bacterium]
MYKLCFYVPESALELVKGAVFDAGAGCVGNYERCCWQLLGEGQFRPLPGSNPHMGSTNQLEAVPEYRVEVVCDDEYIDAAVTALKKSHPYETPAFDVIKLTAV